MTRDKEIITKDELFKLNGEETENNDDAVLNISFPVDKNLNLIAANWIRKM